MAVLAALRWVIVLASTAFGLAYIGYKEHSNISVEVTTDFKAVAEEQQALLDKLATLLPQLLDPNLTIELNAELKATRELAQDVIVSLGRFRAPTSRIDDARIECRDSLETLIGVTHRIERDGVEGMALPLHNTLQLTANRSGDFLNAVQDFQGGAWPQVIGTFF